VEVVDVGRVLVDELGRLGAGSGCCMFGCGAVGGGGLLFFCEGVVSVYTHI